MGKLCVLPSLLIFLLTTTIIIYKKKIFQLNDETHRSKQYGYNYWYRTVIELIHRFKLMSLMHFQWGWQRNLLWDAGWEKKLLFRFLNHLKFNKHLKRWKLWIKANSFRRFDSLSYVQAKLHFPETLLHKWEATTKESKESPVFLQLMDPPSLQFRKKENKNGCASESVPKYSVAIPYKSASAANITESLEEKKTSFWCACLLLRCSHSYEWRSGTGRK